MHMGIIFCVNFRLSYIYISLLIKVRRAGLNVEFAPDPIAYQLNVRSGALVLKVDCISGTLVLSWNKKMILSMFCGPWYPP
jgi:hypothetical protein